MILPSPVGEALPTKVGRYNGPLPPGAPSKSPDLRYTPSTCTLAYIMQELQKKGLLNVQYDSKINKSKN